MYLETPSHFKGDSGNDNCNSSASFSGDKTSHTLTDSLSTFSQSIEIVRLDQWKHKVITIIIYEHSDITGVISCNKNFTSALSFSIQPTN